jgi:hypothetical protein
VKLEPGKAEYAVDVSLQYAPVRYTVGFDVGDGANEGNGASASPKGSALST